jgi:hypothetical protein
MDMWTLFAMGEPELRSRFPVTRRFFDNGFEPDPRNHVPGKLGLATLNQTIRLCLSTGEFEVL